MSNRKNDPESQYGASNLDRARKLKWPSRRGSDASHASCKVTEGILVLGYRQSNFKESEKRKKKLKGASRRTAARMERDGEVSAIRQKTPLDQQYRLSH